VLLREINAGEYFGETRGDRQPAAVIRNCRDHGCDDGANAGVGLPLRRARLSDVCDQLLSRLAAEIRKLANRVNEFTTLDARYRIYAELLRLAKPAAGKSVSSVISPPPVHADIAARVSIRREAVARELKALERAGLVQRRTGALVLTDRTACVT